MLKRIASGISALVVSLSSLFVFAPMIASAAVDICEWDGSSSSAWNTAANWSCDTDGAAVPGAGDSLVFPYGEGVTNKTLNNDVSAGTSFASITFSGTPSTSEGDYVLGGNSVTLTSGITSSASDYVYPRINQAIAFNGTQTISTSTKNNLALGGVLSGSGTLTKSGTGGLSLYGDNTFTGSLTISAGAVFTSSETGLGASSAGTTVADGAGLSLGFSDGDTFTVAEPLTLNGEEYNDNGLLYVYVADGQQFSSDADVTLSGDIVLGADVQVGIGSGKLTLTGELSGDHKISVYKGSVGKLIVDSSDNSSDTPNGTLVAPKFTTKYSSKAEDSSVNIVFNETGIVTGKYLYGTVGQGGTLKGTGSFKSGLFVTEGGTIAPGLSPGCLSASESTGIYGTVQIELAGTTACSKYDQLKAKGTVQLTSGADVPVSAILAVSIINNYKPTVGSKYIIISNDGKDKITGTFKGLKEGATFKTPSGSVLKISYKGGTGNDVELTLLKVGTPDTGFGLLLNNPAAILGASVLAAGAILMMSRRFAPAMAGKRKSRR